jgi:starch phosphorylase
MVRACRHFIIRQYGRRNAPKTFMLEAESILDPDVLTIAFARRFATYKRANLLLHDPDRFKAILTSRERPVQFIFSGKAHPKDNEGKDLIRNIIAFGKKHDLLKKIVFLEDYDINIARYLLQGADVWLNTPRRPYEACGTSGIKAAINGVLNVSILDGWWDEGFSEEAGWRIGNGEEYDDSNYQDAVESQALYNILEEDVIPSFYDRKDGNVPSRWVAKMKSSMIMAMNNFCAMRMVGEYEDLFYRPAAKRLAELTADNSKEAGRLNKLHERLRAEWKNIRIEHPARESHGPFPADHDINVTVRVFLGNLQPEEVEVELYYGIMQSVDTVESSQFKTMNVENNLNDGQYLYACTISCHIAGRYGFTARVVPRGDDMLKYTPGLITWA